MAEREEILKYLETEFCDAVRDPIWKHIYLTPAFAELISLAPFQDLHDIRQLGPAYLVYPGATHTRFAHSLGTFHLAQRIIRNLVSRAERLPFSLYGVKAYLAAALLHDVGHYPFAHALKNLGLLEHERLTARLVQEDPLATVLRESLCINPSDVAGIVDISQPLTLDSEIAFFRKLLSGVLDPDKLDYLNRDAYFCGVPYGIQDVDFFLEEIVLDREDGFQMTAKGITAVENILFSKYLMYKTVYWHKTVRIATAMIKKALLLALADAVIAPDDLYLLTDRLLLEMVHTISYPPFKLIENVFRRSLYKQVASIDFNPRRESHRFLAQRDFCLLKEQEIAQELSKLVGRKVLNEEVIIDLPEEISFELDLKIVKGLQVIPFRQTRNVFTANSVLGVAENLRHLRLAVAPAEDLIAASKNLVNELEMFKP